MARLRDKRPVDELSIEELEQILALRKREARQERLQRYGQTGRRASVTDTMPEGIAQPIEHAIAPYVDPAYAYQAEPEPEAAELAITVTAANVLDGGSIPIDPIVDPIADFEGDPRFEDDPPETQLAIASSRQKVRPYPANGALNGRSVSATLAPLAARRNAQAVAQALDTDSAGLPLPARRIVNGGLLFVEVAAVMGLAFIFFTLYQSLNKVEQTTAQIQQDYEATARAGFVAPTATPIIDAPVAVLPTGHIYRDGQALINLDEVPVEFRTQYSALQLKPPPEPTLSPEAPIRVQIPSINVDSAVYYGDNNEVLKRGVGHHQNGINPGQAGNLVLSAHNDVYAEIFRYLDRLKPGDTVVVSTTSRRYTYQIEETQKVKPTDVWVLGSRGKEQQITLISCYPYRQNYLRIVVFGRLVSAS